MDFKHGNLSEVWPADFALGLNPAQVTRRPTCTSACRRVLLISYAFPPTGGGGVQRAAKFVKYLPQFGWQPTVLTVANPSVPVRDCDLAAELDPHTEIVHARTWEPGYGVKQHLAHAAGGRRSTVRRLLRQFGMQVLQPDPQVLWNPSALRAAGRTLRAQRYDAILVTGPPFSSFLLGHRLKRRFGIPLALDFRDEWLLVAQHLENYQLSGLAYRWQHAMMRRVLQAADQVIATTRASADELARHCRRADSDARVSCVYNGFDPDDLRSLPAEPTGQQKLRIVYTGTLWKLTDIGPLVQALSRTTQTGHAQGEDVELVLAGRRTSQQDAVLDRLQETGVSVARHDYLPHSQALRLAASADVLLLLLSDQPGAERVVPAKLFEYLALGRAILAIVPDGETRDLLKQHPCVALFRPHEVDRIAAWLHVCPADRHRHRSHCGVTLSDPRVAQFARPHLTGQLADVLNRCVTEKCVS